MHDNVPISNLFRPRFHKKAGESSEALPGVLLSQSGNCGLNKYWSPECQWHRAQIKLLRGPGAGAAEICHMPEFRVKLQKQIVKICHLETTVLNFPELFSVQRPAHALHHTSALRALALTVSASLEPVECHLTDVYQQGISSLDVDWLPFFFISCRLTMRCSYFKYGAMASIVIIIACIKALEISHGSCT